MPNDGEDSSLDALFAEAELVAQPTAVHSVVKCSHAHDNLDLPTTKCRTCAFHYCEACASELDPTYCKTCLNEPSAQLISTPLVDEDGVQHDGRVITPAPTATFYQPRFGTLAKTISEMSDLELEDFVKHYKELIHQAETVLDYRRVVIGTAQMETTQRAAQKRRALAANKTQYNVKTVTIDKSTGKPKVSKANTAQLMQMMQALAALKALKDRQAATKVAAAAAQAVDKKMGEPKL